MGALSQPAPHPQDPPPGGPPKVTKAYAHFLVAGLGAVIPTLCQIAVNDLAHPESITGLYIVGILLRFGLYFLIGGILTHYLYYDEHHPGKLFYAGMAAPALILSISQGAIFNNSKNAPSNSPATQTAEPGKKSRAFSWTVHAQSAGPKRFDLPEEHWTTQIVRGVFGRAQQQVSFTLAGSYPTLEWAQLVQRRAAVSGYPKAEIYAPSGRNDFYSVVIAGADTLAASQARAREARGRDLDDAYAWQYGDPGILPASGSWADQLGRTDYIDQALGKGFAEQLGQAARKGLVQLGAGAVPIVRAILEDPVERRGRSQKLLLERLGQAIAELTAKGVAFPSEVYLTLANIYSSTDCATALPYFSKVDKAALDANPEEHCRIGLCYFYKPTTNLPAAKLSYESCLKLKKPPSSLDHRMYGRTLLELGADAAREGRADEARRSLTQAAAEFRVAKDGGDDPRTITRLLNEAQSRLNSLR